MNLFQSMSMVAALSFGMANVAMADDAPPANPSATNTTSSSDTFHIGETYQEHLQNEMNKNAAQAQQPQPGSRTPQAIGKPVEIDGVNQ